MSLQIVVPKAFRDRGYVSARKERGKDGLVYVRMKNSDGRWMKMRYSRFNYIAHHGEIPNNVKVRHVSSIHDDSIENLYIVSSETPIEYRCEVCGRIHKVFDVETVICCATRKVKQKPTDKREKRRINKMPVPALVRFLRKNGVSFEKIADKLKKPIVELKKMLIVDDRLPFTDIAEITKSQHIRKGRKLLSKRAAGFKELVRTGISSIASLKKQMKHLNMDRTSMLKYTINC